MLTDIGRMRLEAISFFLLIWFIAAFFIKLLWNQLAGVFTKLPRLKFKHAMALTFLWGMLFVLVLTMISGARELLTPGAWEKKGATYQLREGK